MNDFLSRIDDWLIDCVFQRICDWIRMTFRWSKNIPLALSLGFLVYELNPLVSMPSLEQWIHSPGQSVLATFGFYAVFKLIAEHISNEISGKEDFKGTLSSDRLTGRWCRKFILTSLAVGTIMPLFSSQPPTEGWNITWAIALYAYFSACTDLPKPKRNRVSKAVLQG